MRILSHTMAPQATKRRKLEHTPPDEEDDSGSFASFGEAEESAEEDNLDTNGNAPDGIDEEMDSDEDIEESEDDDVDAEEEVIESTKAKLTKTGPNVTKDAPPKAGRTIAKSGLSTGGAYNSSAFKSNVFKLQVDELLDQVRPRHGKRETAAEEALHALKKTIEQLPARPAQNIEYTERQLLKEKITIPFPDPRPPKDAQYKLEFAKPANINVVGSHVLKTAVRTRDVLVVDMALQMPSSLFQNKDFLNYRYFYKRAFYLACIAAGLRNSHAKDYTVRYLDLHDNSLCPGLAISPANEHDVKVGGKPIPNWRINILLSIAPDVFPAEKFGLERNCVRSAGDEGHSEQLPTPLYNSTLRSDMLVTSYLKLQHKAATTCAAFRDASLLGSSWLRQRGFASDTTGGGFGTFEWSALMAVLLQGGGPGGRPILSEGYSNYQLLKATLQLLALRDLRKQPLIVGPNAQIQPTVSGTPVVWDSERYHNLLYKMAPWSYRCLQAAAKTTLSMLSDQNFEGFEAMFILRADNQLVQYDHIVQLDVAGSMTQGSESQHTLAKIHESLQRGLGDRISLINVQASPSSSWNIGAARPQDNMKSKITIGLLVNQENINRSVDHGPSAENKAEAADFRRFWGDKSELRRFKDGSILESLIWSTREDGQSVLEQIVRYLLERHVGASTAASARFIGDSSARFVKHNNGTASFQPLMEAYKQLESDIRGLEALPLSIRQIMPADAQLRFASTEAPLAGRNAVQTVPAAVTLQFEGSSRWPDNLVAIQRTKLAFLLKLSELLDENVGAVKTRIGLENEETDVLNQGFLDIIYDSGAAFRLRIHHEREQGMLERRMKNKDLDPRTKEVSALALARYKREFVKTPAHTQAIAALCIRYPVLSGTIRLTKKWFASHLLTNHIADEIIELLVARAFVQPWPWQTPSSVQTAFLRTLSWISRWDWRADPLIVDLSGSVELKQADMQAIGTRFEAWRKLDPALNRVVMFAASIVDHDGTTWTDGQPSKVVAGRMTALAKAAIGAVEVQKLDLDLASLFVSPLSDYDFVLHLSSGQKTKKAQAFKNLELDALSDTSLVGYEPVAAFLSELETLYGSAVLFFSGSGFIAGLWNPQTAPRSWKVNLSYATEPVKQDEDVMAVLDKESILKEVAVLGGDLVSKVEVNR